MPQATEPYWFTLVSACQAGRYPAITPLEFETMLREGMERENAHAGTGYRFTNGKDATAVCIPQYNEGFLRLMSNGGQLAYTGCAWGDTDARQLASAVVYAHAAGSTTKASAIRLGQNQLTDAAMPSLIEIFTAGAMPNLQFLALEDNWFTDAGLRALYPVLSGMLSSLRQLGIGSGLTSGGVQMLAQLLAQGSLKKLKSLYLQNNVALGDDGAGILASAISDGWLSKLTELRLNSTGIGDVGATALADALRCTPKLRLETLVIGRNQFGRSAAEGLHEACADRGIKLMHSVFHKFEPHKMPPRVARTVPAKETKRTRDDEAVISLSCSQQTSQARSEHAKRARAVRNDPLVSGSASLIDDDEKAMPPLAVARASTSGTTVSGRCCDSFYTQSTEPQGASSVQLPSEEQQLWLEDDDLLELDEGATPSGPMSLVVVVHVGGVSDGSDEPGIEIRHLVSKAESTLLSDALAELGSMRGLVLSAPSDSKGSAIENVTVAAAWCEHGIDDQGDFDSDLHIWCRVEQLV